MNRLKIYHLLIVSVVIAVAISGCTNKVGTTKTEGTDETVNTASSKPSSKKPSPWEQAYGEPLEQEENELDSTSFDDENRFEQAEFTPIPITDLWQRIRNGYAIASTTMQPDTHTQLEWFIKHPDYVNRVVERARPYLHYIVDELEQRNMPLEIALLPVVESGFQPYAYSSGRAAGLWQFIPGTGKVYGLEQNWWYDGRRDVIASTKAAIDYLQKLHNDFGNWQLALAAYNCGEGTVGRAIKRNQQAGQPTDFWSLNLPKETSAYVPKLMAVAHLVKNPDKYNIALSPIDNVPFLTIVDTGSQIDLSLAAKLANITTDEMYQLNPGFNQFATSPDGPHQLVVPVDKAEQFQNALDLLPDSERVQWTRHKIKSGDSLGKIAKHYHTTVSALKQANALSSNFIKAGQNLLIPVARTNLPSGLPATQSQRLATQQLTTSDQSKKVHTVRAGDTWWDIANNYNVDVKKLTSWNSKAPSDILRPGQKLIILSETTSSKTNKTTSTVKYTIRSGDSLWSISQKFNVTVSQLREWNSLSDRTLLKPGQNLTLYVDVTKQSGHI
ncbi:MAG: LysM peptidoglycan-binding domain-containing protein [Gammaproteobacteria bacterium]|nr:LysM peptidoglycan-binding domain-containing protein [Gammaproteobacteria bacterium]